MATTETIDPIKEIGPDSTSTFENDPKFTEPTPGSEGSSDNIEEQRDTDDVEEDDEDADDEDELEDDEFDEDDDLDDEDEDVDEEEEFDDEDDAEAEEDLDDLDDEEEEDDAEEVAAAPGTNAPAAMRADGLLGYEDEADDVQNGRTEEQGNADRARAESRLKQPGNTRGTGRATDTDGDDDAGDLAPGVTVDEFTDDDMDTDRVAALPVDLLNWPANSYPFGSYIGAQPNTYGTLQ